MQPKWSYHNFQVVQLYFRHTPLLPQVPVYTDSPSQLLVNVSLNTLLAAQDNLHRRTIIDIIASKWGVVEKKAMGNYYKL